MEYNRRTCAKYQTSAFCTGIEFCTFPMALELTYAYVHGVDEFFFIEGIGYNSGTLPVTLPSHLTAWARVGCGLNRKIANNVKSKEHFHPCISVKFSYLARSPRQHSTGFCLHWRPYIRGKTLSNNSGTTHYYSLQGSYWTDQRTVIMRWLWLPY